MCFIISKPYPLNFDCNANSSRLYKRVTQQSSPCSSENSNTSIIKMKLFLIAAVSLIICSSVHAEKGKKIVFDTSRNIDENEIEFNFEEGPAVGSEEYYDEQRWIAVTSEGYEYEGTIEEVKALSADLTDDDEESDPATSPSMIDNSIETLQSNDPVQTSSNSFDSDEDEILEKRASTEEEDDLTNKITEQVVFGRDDRRRVTNVGRFPYNVMGRIDIGCTGTLIRRNVVLTAGHCLHGGRGKSWYSAINFRRQKNCDPNGGFLMRYRRAVTYKAWTKRSRITHDIGIIILRSSYPYYMRVVAKRWRHIRRSIVNIAGYPGDKRGRCLWRSHCRVRITWYNRLFYRCDTAGGMSGSAVYHYIRGRREIIGVHAYGGRRNNSGTRINRRHKRNLNSWICRYTG